MNSLRRIKLERGRGKIHYTEEQLLVELIRKWGTAKVHHPSRC
jgi:hypothetical protein